MRRVLASLALVTLLASPATALEARSFPRATAPYPPSLGTALAGVVPGSFHISYNGAVVIEAADWTGVNLATVQSAVDAAVEDSAPERAKAAVDGTQGLPACLVEAMARALVPVLNQARTTPTTSFAAITADSVRTSLKAQVEALGCGE